MLHPFLLLFLPLAAVPLLLHLITLYRLKTVELSTFRFLMDSYVQQRRRLKLLEWLLMVLRTAFVALIVLMLSRPVVEKFGFLFGGGTGRDVALIVDAGVTSGLQTGGSTALKRAKETARVVAKKLSQQDYVTLIRAGSQPQVLYRGYLADADELLQKIDALTADIATADLAAALTEAVAAPPHGARVLYVVSDLQRRSWAPLTQHPIHRQLGRDVQLVVMNVGSQEPVANLALLGDPPRSQRPIVDLPLLLTCKVAASEREHPIGARVAVVLDDQIVGHMEVTIQPGQPATGSLTVTPSRAGLIKGRFELPTDAFPDDNTYQFCLNVEPRIRVLLITTPGATPLEDPAVYLRAALASPLLAKGRGNEEDKQIAKSLAVTAIRSGDLEESKLADADVVVAADVQMNGKSGSLLRKHVERGGGLLMFGGPHVDPNVYQQSFFSATMPRGGKEPLARYEAAVGNLDDESTFRPIATVDVHHPVLSLFARGETDYFGAARLYRYLPLRLTAPPAVAPSSTGLAAARTVLPATALMKLPDQSPVMAEVPLGAGRMLVCSFAATPEWSNLPTRALFVPLLLRSIVHVRPASPVEAAFAVRPHEPAPIHLSRPWQGARVEATTPSGQIRPVELHPADDRLVGALMQTDARGYYSFQAQPPSSLSGEPTVQLGFAVNLDIDQAGFESVSKQQVEKTFADTPLAFISGTADDPVLSAQLSQRREIWRWLIWGMFAVMAVEFTLSTLKSGEPAERGSSGSTVPESVWRQWTGPLKNRIGRALGMGETVGKA